MSEPVPSAEAGAPPMRGRIGTDARYGHYAVPHRYRLHLSATCPHCLRISVTHALLGLDETLPVTLLPPVPDRSDGGYAALDDLYEASSHQHPGPSAAPVLSDTWTGRVVSTYAPEIVRDLAARFGDGLRPLRPCASAAGIDALARLCDHDIEAAAVRAGGPDPDPAAATTVLNALSDLEHRLGRGEFLLGAELSTADVHAWVTLLMLDTVHRWHLAAPLVERVADHPRLWAYARRLAGNPAFGGAPDRDGMALRHHAPCGCRDTRPAGAPLIPGSAYAQRAVRAEAARPVCHAR
ncbi:glutathione S-transferase family protein [Streptomyces sp. NBC_01497]|uniref:glutathione S-transferase family protein n=1 Tax=Streptomyces sp. NBC_01497 TaxID=2903885 RepID=UPI002E381D1A|nr:glutathione S-transferase C-terminal domain-containing protein [Streptomyces sp. NBC_01497]